MDLVRRLMAAFAVGEVEELGGGHQSRAFRVTGRDGSHAVAKVVDASMVGRVEFDARLDVIEALADLDPRVCRPLLVDGRRVTELTSADGGKLLVTCFEFASGIEPDPARADDAARMGVALSKLHVSMNQLPPTSLPVVHALRTSPASDAPEAGPHQLLHGDFNASNLRETSGIMRIFDLDDCGYGPPAFDVANALYMVLFDAVIQGSIELYESFRRSFVDGYVGTGGPSVSEGTLDRFIDLRVRALGSWLEDLDTAPVGIRTASDVRRKSRPAAPRFRYRPGRDSHRVRWLAGNPPFLRRDGTRRASSHLTVRSPSRGQVRAAWAAAAALSCHRGGSP